MPITLADILRMDGSSALQDEWTAQVRVAWAGYRASASADGGGSAGGAWLDGEDADAIACDAAMAPVVTGEVNLAALEDLVRLCVQLDRLRHGASGDTGTGSTSGDGQAAPCPGTTRAREALEQGDHR